MLITPAPVSSAILQCNISRARHSVENGVAKMKNNKKDISRHTAYVCEQYVFKQNLKNIYVQQKLCRDQLKITSLSKLGTSSKPKRDWKIPISLKISFTFGAFMGRPISAHILLVFFSCSAGSLWAQSLMGFRIVLDVSLGPFSHKIHQNPRKTNMHHLSRCISH